MRLDVKLTEDNSIFPLTFINDDSTFEVKFESLQVLHIDDAEYYDGETFFIPNFFGKMFMTENKKLRNNILVSKIPVNEVSNPQGGNTVTIGG